MDLVALSGEDESLAQWGQAWTFCHHGCSWESHSFSLFSLIGVEFGARMVNIDGKQIKLQIWDTVRENKKTFVPNITVETDSGIKGYDGGAKDGGQSSVQFSHSVMSSSLRPHGLQHARPPCPSPTAGTCSNSCPLSQWCHPAISSSVIPFSSCLQSCPASESFPVSQFFASGDKSIGALASASVLPMNIQDWFPLGWTGWISLQSKGLSRVFSNTTVQKHQFFGA